MTRAARPAVVLAAVVAISGVSFAQSPTAGPVPGTGARAIDLSSPQPAECLGDGPWVAVAPYAWVYGMKGTVGAGLRTAQVDLSVGDAVSQMDKLDGAAQLHVETGYRRFGLIADLMCQRIVPLDGPVAVSATSTILELLGTYRVLDTGGRQAGAVTLDVLAGARYYRFSNQIAGNVFDLFVAERSNKWIDLVVGARAGVQVTDDLGVFARADVGGFGIGDSSRRACNVIVGAEYRLCDRASVLAGYRWFKIDRQAGLGRDRFVLDATMFGPFVAFAVRF